VIGFEVGSLPMVGAISGGLQDSATENLQRIDIAMGEMRRPQLVLALGYLDKRGPRSLRKMLVSRFSAALPQPCGPLSARAWPKPCSLQRTMLCWPISSDAV
jgi:hypothetical protein